MWASGRASVCLFAVLGSSLLLFGCGGAQSRLASHMRSGDTYFEQGNFAKASIEFRNALQIAPKDVNARLMAGRAAEKLGHPRDAAALYQSVVDDQPENLEAHKRLGQLLIFAGAADRGLKVIEPQLIKHPNDADLLTLRAAARWALKQQTGALADADKALQLAPGNEDTVALRARMYQDTGDPQQAVSLVAAALGRNPNSTALREVLANIYLAANEPAQAEQQMKALIAQKPQELHYRTALALFYSRSQRLDDAQHVLEQAVQALPHSDAARFALVDFIAAQRTRAQGESILRSFITKDPGNYDLRLGLGALLERNADVAGATTVYQEVVRRDPSGSKGLLARNRLAAIAAQQGRFDDEKRLLEEVLQKDPRNNDALMMRARLELIKDDPRGAITDLRVVLRDQPTNIDLLRTLAVAHEANGEVALAEQSLRNAIDVAPAQGSLRVLLAQLLLRSRRTDDALTVLEEAAQRIPDDVGVREELIGAYLLKPDPEAARRAAGDLQTLKPEEPAGFYLAGLADEAQHHLDDAQQQYRQALKLQPNAFDALEALAHLELLRGKGTDAIALVKAEMARTPNSALPVNLLGGVYLAQGNLPLAIQTLTTATTLDPNWVVPYRNLALAQLQAKDLPGAVLAYQSAMKAAPNDPKLAVELAEVFEGSGRIDDAIALYDSWNRQNPHIPVVARNLAMLLVNYRSDRASLDRARDLTASFGASNDGSFLDSNGWVHFKRAEYSDALPVLTRAASRAPDSKEIRYHLGMAELRAGDSARARSDLESALNGPQHFRWSDDARTALASLKSG
jgi:tetratricopeptide (TPR) repeat protein